MQCNFFLDVPQKFSFRLHIHYLLNVYCEMYCITIINRSNIARHLKGAFQIIAWRAGTWPRPYENRVVRRGGSRTARQMQQVKDFRDRSCLVGRQTLKRPSARFKPPEGDCKARICNEQPALVGFKRVAGGFSLWRHKRHARNRLNLVRPYKNRRFAIIYRQPVIRRNLPTS